MHIILLIKDSLQQQIHFNDTALETNAAVVARVHCMFRRDVVGKKKRLVPLLNFVFVVVLRGQDVLVRFQSFLDRLFTIEAKYTKLFLRLLST